MHFLVVGFICAFENAPPFEGAQKLEIITGGWYMVPHGRKNTGCDYGELVANDECILCVKRITDSTLPVKKQPR